MRTLPAHPGNLESDSQSDRLKLTQQPQTKPIAPNPHSETMVQGRPPSSSGKQDGTARSTQALQPPLRQEKAAPLQAPWPQSTTRCSHPPAHPNTSRPRQQPARRNVRKRILAMRNRVPHLSTITGSKTSTPPRPGLRKCSTTSARLRSRAAGHAMCEPSATQHRLLPFRCRTNAPHTPC